MGIIRSLVPVLAGIAAVLVAAPAVAADAETPPPETAAPVWTFTANAYLWMAGLNGNVGVKGLGPADVNVDFDQIFNHIDWFPRRS
jgi:hypothetical protein